MTPTLNAIITACVYISTAIATLRAGSRALYIAKHDGKLGIMDGPLILGPEDVLQIKENSQGEDGVEVSELWESAYGFQKAVELSLLGTTFSQEKSSTPDQQFDVVTVGNIAIENKKRGYYSLASPHKSSPAHDDSLSKENDDFPEQSSDVVLDGKASKSVSSFTFWRKSRMLPNNIRTETVSGDTSSIHSIHQSLIGANSGNKKSPSKQDEGGCDDDDELLDCSTFLSSIIPVPTTPTGNEDDENEKREKRSVTAQSQRFARIKAYAPNAFTSLRSRFGIEEDDFTKSLMGSGPYVSFQSNSKGAARSGGYFFFTRDGAYMVKTIKKAEVAAFLDVLPKYQKYMMRHGRGSLISRCCGIYGVQISDSSHQVGHR